MLFRSEAYYDRPYKEPAAGECRVEKVGRCVEIKRRDIWSLRFVPTLDRCLDVEVAYNGSGLTFSPEQHGLPISMGVIPVRYRIAVAHTIFMG